MYYPIEYGGDSNVSKHNPMLMSIKHFVTNICPGQL